MLKGKQGEFGLVPLLVLLFGSVLFVSAIALNSTDNSSVNIILNDTLLNISLNESIVNQLVTENINLINESINLTIPIENLSINQSVNLTLNVTFNNQIYLNETINRSIYLNLSLIASNTNPSNYTKTINQSVVLIENRSNILNYIGILAKVFNEDNLDFDGGFKKDYLDWYKNFSNLTFEKIIAKNGIIFTVGAKNDNIKGYNVNNKNYAFHLVYCDSYTRYCIFKINGVPTKRLFSFKDFGDTRKNSFDFDEIYNMKIDSVEFDFCDNRRFCHLGYEGYNIVNVSIEVKR